jgi:hypothetical protein
MVPVGDVVFTALVVLLPARVARKTHIAETQPAFSTPLVQKTLAMFIDAWTDELISLSRGWSACPSIQFSSFYRNLFL